MNKPKFRVSLLALAVAALLAACGGGGGGTASVSPATTAPVDVNSAAPVVSAVEVGIQAQVLPATYAVGTEQRNAYDYLNAQRSQCGFGLLQQDAKLDVAAQGHAAYLSANHLLSHDQDKVNYPNGFTGATLNDRFTAAGYAATSGAEVLTDIYPETFFNSYGSSFGQSGVMDLFTAPYHGSGQLFGERDIGIGYAETNTFWKRFVVDIGSTKVRPRQQIPVDQVLTYPCAGTKGILSKSYGDEIPKPIAGRNLITDPIGHPIYIKVRDGNVLILSGYSLRKAGDNVDLALKLLNKANDKNELINDDATAILMPLLPMEKNSTYIFTASGTNSGKIISISFTFETGAY